MRIDKLTRSIQLRISGDKFDTIIQRLWPADSKLLKDGAWQFDWELELHQKNREVYTLTTILNPTIIQGLISLEDLGDHIFVHLIENAEFNKGRQKLFEGCPEISLRLRARCRSKKDMVAPSFSSQKPR